MNEPMDLHLGDRVRVTVRGEEYLLVVDAITVKYQEDKTTIRIAVKEPEPTSGGEPGQRQLGLDE